MSVDRQPVAWSPVFAVAGTLSAVLVAVSGRYGYHRDELYFLRAGKDLAWGYPDQPPLTPLIARLMDTLAPGSLLALRLPAALAVGLTVVLTGLLARELGGGRAAQLLAAACTAVGAVFVLTGHLHSTTTYDLLAWTALTLLLTRVLRGGDPRLWLAVGALAGIGLLNKQLVAFLLLAVAVGALAVGPRDVLRSPWPWAGAVLALALWTPHLLWQAGAGWPALEVASSVADGGSASSEPRAAFLPFQLLLVSPVLVPIWLAGLHRLWHEPRLRCLALSYPLLAVVFLVSGGKPYYLAGLYPLLLAAGAAPTIRWLQRSRRRTPLLVSGLALSAAVSATIGLPVVPVDRLGDSPVLALNEDAGETVGWPALVRTVAGVHQGIGGESVFLTANYGEAGAIDRFGPAAGLPAAYSGHNGYADWGPPAERDLPVVAVGLRREQLDRWFGRCQLAARIDNGVGVDNEEQGRPVHVCRERRAEWADLWPQIRRLG
ncbi:MAG: glycosyltransferase family 39 protein [Actinomycetota bacterium]|nr:glycosyltransferase family 39 protein [Actinomycetota bacterium]